MRFLPEDPPNISERAVHRAWAVVGVLVVLVMIGLVVGLLRLAGENDSMVSKIERSDAEQAKLSKRVDDEHAAAQALKEQVKRLGGKPVAEPGEPPAGPQGPGPTESQVNAAIADYCADGRCRPTISRAQAEAAVAAYCASGACRGEKGDTVTPEDGRDGNDGADSTVPGPQGPGPTAEQVDAAVAAYCADGRCRGEKGDKGDSVKGDTGDTGSVTPGDYTCPEGQWMTAIHVADGGAMTVDCSPLIGRGD